MKFTDTLKELEAKAQFSIAQQMDLEAFLRNHAQEIINLVEAAENVSKYPDVDKYLGSMTFKPLEEALAALNKEQS
jgi:hypothetical protein